MSRGNNMATSYFILTATLLLKSALDEKKCPSLSSQDTTTKPRFPNSVSHFANGLVTINRKDMFDTYDFGVPINSGAENEDILMIYDSTRALPSDKDIAHAAQYSDDIPHVSAVDATANCETMNVMFVKNPGRRQCMAIVGGQYQGYHIQRWMRLVGSGAHGKIDASVPLKQVSRMTKSDGYDELLLPKTKQLALHREILMSYLTNLNDLQEELKAILTKIAINNTVVVMTVNKGQSELLLNWYCSAKSRGFDTSNVLLFPTDQFSKDLADGLGLATVYDEKLMHLIPSEEAARYGDNTFGMIMMAKVSS